MSEVEKRVEYRRVQTHDDGIHKVIFVYKAKELRDVDWGGMGTPRDVTITRRKKPRTFSWAVRQVEQGRSVRRRAWGLHGKMQMLDGLVLRIEAEDYQATDWELA